MSGRQRFAALAQELLDLQSAARIRAGEQLGSGREHVADFASANLIGAFRLNEIVDSGAATTLLTIGNLDEVGSPGTELEFAL